MKFITLLPVLIFVLFIKTDLLAQNLSDGLVASYSFNGNANDESGNGNNGIAYDAVPADDRCGIPENAYSFDGYNSQIIIKNSEMLDTVSRISLCAWIKPVAFTGVGSNSIIDKANDVHENPNYQYHLAITGIDYPNFPSTFSFYISLDHQITRVIAGTWNPGSWYFVVGTYDGISLKLYTNGVLVDSLYNPGVLDHFGNDIYIGNFRNVPNAFTPGIIDDIKIYNRAISADEVLQLYEINCELSELIGPTEVCAGQQNVEYNAEFSDTMTSYSWNYSGAGVVIHENSEKVLLDFSENASSGNLTVTATSKNSEVQSVSVLIAVNSCASASGLIAFYPFNGNANDESGNGHDGAVNNAKLTTDRCNNANSAYYFNGSTDYIWLGTSPVFRPEHITVACWFLTSSNETMQMIRWRSYGYVIGIRNYNFPTVSGLYSGLHVGNSISNYYYFLTDDKNYSDGIWHFAVFTYDGSTAKMYVDGQLIDQDNQYGNSALYCTDGGMAIGRDGENSALFFNGKLDDIRIYDRAISEEEVRQLYFTDCMISEINGPLEACQGQQDVYYFVQPLDSVASYQWSYNGTGGIITGETNSVLIDFADNATSGNLAVTVTMNNGKIHTTSIHVLVNAIPSKPLNIAGAGNICQGQNNVSYSIPSVENASGYLWNYSGTGAAISGNSENIMISFSENATSGNLTVTGYNSCGAGVASDAFPIIVDECNESPADFNIPNSFSPNGDGINDVLYIRGLKENSTFIVFDRNGSNLFESSDYQNDWDGKDMKGHILESGTYWYVLIMPGIPAEFKGFVYLKK